MLGDRIGQPVVALLGDLDRLVGVEDGLDARRVDRQERVLDAGPVHPLDAHVVGVEDLPREHVVVRALAGEVLGLRQSLLDRHMLLECDLSLHRTLLPDVARCCPPKAGRTACRTGRSSQR